MYRALLLAALLWATPAAGVTVTCTDGTEWEGESIDDFPGCDRVGREPAKPRRETATKADGCTADDNKAGRSVIMNMDTNSRDVFVNPALWRGMTFDTRKGWSDWASKCLFGSKNISIRHGNTGKTLATYGPGWGYSSKE